jgi:hypothetical protein
VLPTEFTPHNTCHVLTAHVLPPTEFQECQATHVRSMTLSAAQAGMVDPTTLQSQHHDTHHDTSNAII